jgi:hypothetical protein
MEFLRSAAARRLADGPGVSINRASILNASLNRAASRIRAPYAWCRRVPRRAFAAVFNCIKGSTARPHRPAEPCRAYVAIGSGPTIDSSQSSALSSRPKPFAASSAPTTAGPPPVAQRVIERPLRLAIALHQAAPAGAPDGRASVDSNSVLCAWLHSRKPRAAASNGAGAS